MSQAAMWGNGSWKGSTPKELARHGAMNLVFVTRWKSTERSDGSWKGLALAPGFVEEDGGGTADIE
jgi:hypothetical protein